MSASSATQRAVKVHDFYVTPTKAYIVMELLKGGDMLEHVIESEEGRLSENVAAGCVKALLSGAFYLTLVPVRPRRRGERRSLRTLPVASLRPGSLAFNPRPRRLSIPPDAFQLHPDIRSHRGWRIICR